MFRRLIILAGVAALACALAAPALAVRVKVRVEGKTTTIYGTSEPALTTGTNALAVLDAASIAGEFYYHVTQTGFGPYVDQVGRYGGTASSGWVFKVDDVSPPVGADKVTLQDGDRVLWYYATFGPTGGPATLSVKASAKGCYRAQAFDDNGKAAVVSGLVFHVGSKRTIKGNLNVDVCPGPHPGVLVRATATGAVRSNAVK